VVAGLTGGSELAELVWEGKYDSGGHRKAPLRVALPFQTVETVNESAQQRQRALDLFAASRDPEWRNRLIWGDKKYVMPALLGEFADSIDLIYVDPPFATGQDFSFITRIPGGSEEFVKEPSIIEQKAYRDTWGKGIDSYLQWFCEAALFMHQLLKENGSLYVHLGVGVAHAVKQVLDEVFGPDGFSNEVIWHYRRWTNVSGTYQQMHDVILYYVKGPTPTFNKIQIQPTESQQAVIDRGYNVNKVDGKEGKVLQLLVYDRDKVDALVAAGKLDTSKYGRIVYRDTTLTAANDVWTDIQYLHSQAVERTGYATQKPEALLSRIIEISSNPGDLVADFFCGSGTTPVVAEKSDRRWLSCDLSRFAIHTTRKRLLGIDNISPFLVQNLGKYERQLWQEAEFGPDAEERTKAYRKLILDLYHATPVDGYIWLHGVKAGAMVHVGSVDAPVTMSDVTNIIAEAKKATGPSKQGTKVPSFDVLGWDFAFELHEVASQKAAEANMALHFVRIPREVLDKRAVEQGDIKFFELAALAVDVRTKKRAATLKLTNFVIPVDDVPDDVQKTIKKWSDWIDYWAVDWDNKGDAFHNEWQTFRTRDNQKLEVETSREYAAPGTYRVVVKVIDILGNDTTKTLDIEVM
jgi:adenine-specific DNA-methyltransferase